VCVFQAGKFREGKLIQIDPRAQAKARAAYQINLIAN
jgi:hypothetical protein